MKKAIFLSILFLFLMPLFANTFVVKDKPNDDGSATIIDWEISNDNISSIVISRTDGKVAKSLITTAKLKGHKEDSEDITAGKTYHYTLVAYDSLGSVIVSEETDAMPKAQWFNTGKISLLIMSLILAFSIMYYIFSAKSGKDIYIRPIAGLESMDEAVGRATEMGKPIMFVPGINDIDDMQTIAGLTILGKLAFKAAEHNADILVPVSRSMVLSTAKEIVKESFLKAGRPDAFVEDSVFYLTDDQFGFVAGVDGIIVREQPAAIFLLGAFYAESLILAETGFASGAIQTAGTAMPSQLPFFVAACDYTLIGEELFAASSYLSKDPHQLGSLKGQDMGKAVIVVVLTLGVIFEMLGIHFIKNFLEIH